MFLRFWVRSIKWQEKVSGQNVYTNLTEITEKETSQDEVVVRYLQENICRGKVTWEATANWLKVQTIVFDDVNWIETDAHETLLYETYFDNCNWTLFVILSTKFEQISDWNETVSFQSLDVL